jgi:hypothetical protein
LYPRRKQSGGGRPPRSSGAGCHESSAIVVWRSQELHRDRPAGSLRPRLGRPLESRASFAMIIGRGHRTLRHDCSAKSQTLRRCVYGRGAGPLSCRRTAKHRCFARSGGAARSGQSHVRGVKVGPDGDYSVLATRRILRRSRTYRRPSGYSRKRSSSQCPYSACSVRTRRAVSREVPRGRYRSK